jgi:membrane-associated protease RseP (regulator of RpoE activity)
MKNKSKLRILLTLLTRIFTILAVLTVAIALHELGHMLCMLHYGVEVKEYSIGFGPLVTSFDFRDIQFSLRLIPLGGYVMPGSESILSATTWQIVTIYSAGIMMNFIVSLSVFILTGLISPLRGLRYRVLDWFKLFIPTHFRHRMWMDTNISSSAWRNTLMKLGTMSFMLGVYNILPVLPMDGAKIMMTALRTIDLDLYQVYIEDTWLHLTIFMIWMLKFPYYPFPKRPK